MSTSKSAATTTDKQINTCLKYYEISKELKIVGEANLSIISLLNSSNDRFSKSKKKQIEEILDQYNATLQIIAKEVTKELSPLAKCASIHDCLKRIENQKRALSHSMGPTVPDPPNKKNIKN